MEKKVIAGLLFLIIVISMYYLVPKIFNEKQQPEISTLPPVPSNSSLTYFGFALVDAYFDDPHDSETKVNYADEVKGFTNIAHMVLKSLTEDITDRLAVFHSYHLKAILHVQDLFFEEKSSDGIRSDYDLRSNYKENWNSFIAINFLEDKLDDIGAFYLADEPYWNHISFEELNLTATLIKNTFPNVPILLIEAYAVLDEFKVPQAVDWIGFDQYDTIDPTTDQNYQVNWAKITDLAEKNNDSIIVIMDTQWREYYQSDAGIRPEDMSKIALNYYNLSLSNERVIGIIGYLWPGGFDSPDQLGARDLPENVQAVYKQIGKEILGGVE